MPTIRSPVLLFLPRDLGHPKVVDAWMRSLEAGELASLVARHGGEAALGIAHRREQGAAEGPEPVRERGELGAEVGMSGPSAHERVKKLEARGGMSSKQHMLDMLALYAAGQDQARGRDWRPLLDTTNDPIIAQRRTLPWRSWQRAEDYYSEGQLLWLAIDTLNRELSKDRRSLDMRIVVRAAGGDAHPAHLALLERARDPVQGRQFQHGHLGVLGGDRAEAGHQAERAADGRVGAPARAEDASARVDVERRPDGAVHDEERGHGVGRARDADQREGGIADRLDGAPDGRE